MATPEAVMAVLAKAVPGDKIVATWRDKPDTSDPDVEVDIAWYTWTGTVQRSLEEFAIIVEWEAKCPKISGPRRRYFPDCLAWPDPHVDYAIPKLTRTAVSQRIGRRDPPVATATTAPSAPNTPVPSQRQKPPAATTQRTQDNAQIVLSEAQFRKLLGGSKRTREPDESDDSTDSEEGVYDREAGAHVPMRNVVEGLRMPKAPDASSMVWYPVLWDNGAAWAVAARAKMAEYCCSVKSVRVVICEIWDAG